VSVLGFDGTYFRNLKTDADGELQVDVVSSALPAGAAHDETVEAVVDSIEYLTDYRYQANHLHTLTAGLNIADSAWGDIITYTPPVGKVAYLIGWSVACEQAGLVYRVLVRKEGVNTFQHYGVDGTVVFTGICFMHFATPDTLVIRGYQTSGAAVYFVANAVLILENG